MLQHETELPVSQDRQLCRNAARARQQARWGAQAWALGERACGRRWACVGARAGAAGSWAQRQAESAAGWVSGSSAQGAQGTRGAQATGGVGAQGRAAGCTVRVGHGRPGRGLGAGWVRRLGQLGQFWCTVHLAQF